MGLGQRQALAFLSRSEGRFRLALIARSPSQSRATAEANPHPPLGAICFRHPMGGESFPDACGFSRGLINARALIKAKMRSDAKIWTTTSDEAAFVAPKPRPRLR
jgi:hypothetical protein